MADKLSKIRRSENMRRIKGRDTAPELAVRRIVHAAGFRYRLHRRDLPGKPDLVFGPKKKIIFVHGCFWHSHDVSGCADSRKPKSNKSYWTPKLRSNKERDERHRATLQNNGWAVLTIWDCETKDLERLRTRLIKFLTDTPGLFVRE
ncbi:MAG: very short patch repair endonuclease [Vitreimonas sp.]